MSCKTCKHWNGTRASTQGDCGYIIDREFSLEGITDRFGNPCTLPFDPHDARYYLSTSSIHELLFKYAVDPAFRVTLMDGVDIEVVEEEVLWMDDQEVELIKIKKIPYFKTDKDFHCEAYKSCE